MRIEVSTDIAAPPERVFALLTDVMAWPRNIDAIEHIEVLTPGPVGIGTRFRETRTMFGRKATEEMTIDAMDASHMRTIAYNHGTRYVATHTVAKLPGGARLTLVFEGMPATRLARLFAFVGKLMRGKIEAMLRADLANLKDAAEGRRYIPASPPAGEAVREAD